VKAAATATRSDLQTAPTQPFTFINRRDQMVKFTGVFCAGIAGLAMALPALACPAKIGATLSMTGSYATFGPPISNAAALAVEHMNAAGWKVGDCSKLEYIVRDDQTQPSVGVDAARRLVDVDAVPAIVGPITSGVTGPILSSVTVEKGVLMVPSASSSPTFSDMARDGKLNGLFYRVQPSDALQAVAIAKLAWDAGNRNIAIVYLNNDWGNNLSKQFAATFKAHGWHGQRTGGLQRRAVQLPRRGQQGAGEQAAKRLHRLVGDRRQQDPARLDLRWAARRSSCSRWA
jgi:ABC-type branched-subunit amino acid transport system substrate-binding protein